MTDLELKQWLAVTESSRYQWTEDEITRRNGRGGAVLFWRRGRNLYSNPAGRRTLRRNL